jgi:hypothetical protein
MINFRFHLLSLVAVFLALAVGIVMGTTVINEAIVDGLHNRINAVEDDADAQEAENNRLRDDNEGLREYIDATAEFAVSSRLDGVSVAVVAEDGVDEDAVNATVALAQQAGGEVGGVLWLEDRWRLEDDESVEALEQVLGIDRVVERDREIALQAIAERIAAGSAPIDRLDVLTALEANEFVRFVPTVEGVDPAVARAEWPGPDASTLLVDGGAGGVEAPELLAVAAGALVEADVPVVVAEVFDDGDEERGTVLEPVRGESELVELVSSVDDLDRVEGRVAAVLALSDSVRGVYGHYGEGNGADQPVPDWSQL